MQGHRGFIIGLGLTLALCTGALSGNAESWRHLQISGVAEEICSVTITIGSEVFELTEIPEGTTASEVCEDLADEINSVRHGYRYMASCNGADGSILSIVADGSPVRRTTPWLGRLVPEPQIEVSPSRCGLRIRGTNIRNTMLAFTVEGERVEAEEGNVAVKINGRNFVAQIRSNGPNMPAPSAVEVATQLSGIIDADPGFRSSVLTDDTGQLMIFVIGEGIGGGLRIEQGPSSVDGLRFSRSSVLFASQPVYVGN
jgi:hypothetical protein